MALCQFCCSVTPDRLNDGVIAHHASLGALQHSAAQGCDLCAFLQSILHSDHHTESGNVGGITIEALGFNKPYLSRVRLSLRTRSSTLIVTRENSMKDVFNNFLPYRRIDPHPASKTAFGVVNQWLRSCLSNHPYCVSSVQTPPRRLLDVQDPDIIFLRKEWSGGPYAALSHCWGGTSSLTLNQSTFNSLVSGWPAYKFPTTFQHAIYVTRQLGIPYLWIDSLCILQDCREDWEIESGKMAGVYKGAILTISASNARSTSEGFLKPRQIRMYKLREPGVKGRVFYLQDDVSSGDHTEDEPLNKRAWSLQERILSPRIVHYCNKKMIWECNSSHVSEDDWPSTILTSSLWKFPKHDPTNSKAYAESCYFFWREIVQECSRRQLTVQSDKLPSLSGVALEIFQRFQDSYHAGIWRSDLPRGLLWYVEPEQQRKPDAYKYRAPTWTWAAVDGKVSFTRGKFFRVLAKIDWIFTNRSSENPFGCVSGGAMQVRGVLASVTTYTCEPPECLGINQCNRAPGWDWLGSKLKFEERSGSQRTIQCLGLVQGRTSNGNIDGLIVETTGMGLNQYQRIGYCSICLHHWGNLKEETIILI